MPGIHFVLTAAGTAGDLLPLLALARDLLDRGQKATVLGSEWAAPRARAQVIPFVTIAPACVSNLVGVEECFDRYVFPSYEPTFRFFEQVTSRPERIVVLNWTNWASSTLMCERYGLQLCRLVAAPHFLPSLCAPPQPWASRVVGLAPNEACAALLRCYAKHYSHPYILERLNRHRARWGLAPVPSTYTLSRWICQYIGLFPAWYSDSPRDWPPDFPRVGFPLPEPAGHLPEIVVRHVARHGAPIVFTPGTAAGDSEHFASAARDCCERLGEAGVVLGAARDGCGGSDGRVLELRQVELGLLLRHAALIVHHGGIGTTARALEAGLTQIISPQGFDQPDNAARVVRLGVGTYLPRSTLCGESLAQAVRHLRASSRVEDRAQRLAALVRADRGVQRAVDRLLERFTPCARAS